MKSFVVELTVRGLENGGSMFIAEYVEKSGNSKFGASRKKEEALREIGDTVFGHINYYLVAKGKKEDAEIWEFIVDRELEEKPKKSRAEDMKKSRANAAGYIRDARLTEKAAKSLNRLCDEWMMTKTQVINKLLEDCEQRQLL